MANETNTTKTGGSDYNNGANDLALGSGGIQQNEGSEIDSGNPPEINDWSGAEFAPSNSQVYYVDQTDDQEANPWWRVIADDLLRFWDGTEDDVDSAGETEASFYQQNKKTIWILVGVVVAVVVIKKVF